MDEENFTPFKSSPVLPVFEKFSKVRDVSLVYGDPIEMQGRTIVPVAKIKYSVGAGAGGGYGNGAKDPESPGAEESGGGHGEGAGGSFQVKPVGIYDVTAEKAVYRPIVPVELVIFVPLMVTGLAFMFAASQDKLEREANKKRGRKNKGSRCQNKGHAMKKHKK
ncbi:MAG: hypothetical protein ACQEV0_09230 [Bacillota bacterium]